MAGPDSGGGHLEGAKRQVVWERGPALWVLDPHGSPRAPLPAQRQHSDAGLQGAYHCLPGPARHTGQIRGSQQLGCPSGAPPKHPYLWWLWWGRWVSTEEMKPKENELSNIVALSSKREFSDSTNVRHVPGLGMKLLSERAPMEPHRIVLVRLWNLLNS